MKNAYLSAALVILLASSSVSAGDRLEWRTLEKVALQTEGLFLYARGGWNNPSSCQQVNAVVLLNSDSNFDRAYSLLLSAFMYGKSIRGFSDGCTVFDGKTYNTVRGYKYLEVK